MMDMLGIREEKAYDAYASHVTLREGKLYGSLLVFQSVYSFQQAQE